VRPLARSVSGSTRSSLVAAATVTTFSALRRGNQVPSRNCRHSHPTRFLSRCIPHLPSAQSGSVDCVQPARAIWMRVSVRSSRPMGQHSMPFCHEQVYQACSPKGSFSVDIKVLISIAESVFDCLVAILARPAQNSGVLEPVIRRKLCQLDDLGAGLARRADNRHHGLLQRIRRRAFAARPRGQQAQ
jgi:hypothetical protein